MYEISYTRRFRTDLHKLRSYEYLLPRYISLLLINPFDKRLKSKITKDSDYYGAYRSEFGKNFLLYWKFGDSEKIYLLGIIKK